MAALRRAHRGEGVARLSCPQFASELTVGLQRELGMRSLFIVSLPRSLSTTVFDAARRALGLRVSTRVLVFDGPIDGEGDPVRALEQFCLVRQMDRGG